MHVHPSASLRPRDTDSCLLHPVVRSALLSLAEDPIGLQYRQSYAHHALLQATVDSSASSTFACTNTILMEFCWLLGFSAEG